MAVVRCPTCGARLELDDRYLGHEVDCGDCRATFVARADDAPPRPADDYVPAPRVTVDRDDEPRRSDDPADDRPRPRRSRRQRDRDDLEAAREAVQTPAVGLQVTGWIGIVLGALNLLAAIALPVIVMNVPPPPGGGVNPPGELPPQTEAMINAVVAAVQGVIHIALSVLILTGAARLKRLESQGLVTAAAVVAMIPCISPCCLLGLPFGIIALQAMGKPEVKSAFEANRERD